MNGGHFLPVTMPREHLFANAVKPLKRLKQEGSRAVARCVETGAGSASLGAQREAGDAVKIETRSRALKIGAKKRAKKFSDRFSL